MTFPINPFIVAGAIPPQYFCDRTEDSNKIISRITNGHNIVLMAQRRMGKTGLIKHCFASPDISNRYNTFFIDILPTSSLREFVYLLGKEVIGKLLPVNKKIARSIGLILKSLSGKFGFDPHTGLPTFNIELADIHNPAHTLEEIFNCLRESTIPCIVAIDEFQQIARYPESNIEALLRSHIQSISNCNFIFSGSERSILDEMFVNSARPFYNSTDIIELNSIPLPTYTSFAMRLFNERGKSVSEDAIAFVYDLFKGNTYLLQRIFNQAFAMTPDNSACERETCTAAIDVIIEESTFRFQQTLSTLPGKQKPLLYAIAAEKNATAITSGAFVRRHDLNSPSSVQSAIKGLTEKGLVTSHNGAYSLSDPFFGIWINRTFGQE